MNLDILIASYKETEVQISNLLYSIAHQQGIDFGSIGVKIYNDGGRSIKLMNQLPLPFKFEFYNGEHRGVSATRNRLLDLSESEYVMFCDADDMFTDLFGLRNVFEAMSKGFDVFNSSFYEESLVGNKRRYIVRQNDTYFVHGKVFRRQYLVDNNIRWNDEFEYSGDTYFLGLALRTTKKHVYCSTPFYMWKWNPNSICRREKGHYTKELDMKLRVTSALIDELLRREMNADATYFALFVLYDSYYIMQSDDWENMDDADKRARANSFRAFYKKYENMIKEAKKQMQFSVVRSAKNNQFYRGNIMEKITFNDWLNSILSDEKGG